jgi:chemotaxis protein methyltransferase CheR
VTRFERHNLLAAPPERFGQFDVILCRNVLCYLSPPAIHQVCVGLLRALAPTGVVIFATMDVDRAPEGLVRAAPDPLQIFTPAPPAPPQRRTPAPVPTAPPESTESRMRRAIESHLRALILIERKLQDEAERQLLALHRELPDYLPGVLELALLYHREGKTARGMEVMAEVHRLAKALPPEQVVPAPEPQPASVYVASAEAWLARRGHAPGGRR